MLTCLYVKSYVGKQVLVILRMKFDILAQLKHCFHFVNQNGTNIVFKCSKLILIIRHLNKRNETN